MKANIAGIFFIFQRRGGTSFYRKRQYFLLWEPHKNDAKRVKPTNFVSLQNKNNEKP